MTPIYISADEYLANARLRGNLQRDAERAAKMLTALQEAQAQAAEQIARIQAQLTAQQAALEALRAQIDPPDPSAASSGQSALSLIRVLAADLATILDAPTDYVYCTGCKRVNNRAAADRDWCGLGMNYYCGPCWQARDHHLGRGC